MKNRQARRLITLVRGGYAHVNISNRRAVYIHSGAERFEYVRRDNGRYRKHNAPIEIAYGVVLDRIGSVQGLVRDKGESDSAFRIRILNAINPFLLPEDKRK